MDSNLSELIISKDINTISIIGMAKNTGKTVTLNQIIEELYLKKYRIGLLSYGRDGENFDVITGKHKPPIKVYPGNFFVTADRVLNGSNLKFKKIDNTEITSMMGKVNIYQSLSEGSVQLVGINRLSQLILIREIMKNKVDYLLIDGALDRRSSALPKINGAVVLSTGAVIGYNLKEVIEKTKYEVEKLQLKTLKKKKDLITLQDYHKNKEGVLWTAKDEIISFKTPTSFLLIKEIKNYIKQSGSKVKYIFINGAFTNTIAENILDFKINNFKIIIPNSTKLFIDQMNYNILLKNNIVFKVLYPLNLIALTVNPYNPEGNDLDQKKMLTEIRKEFNILVFNVRSKDY